ncbi:MAG: hypothetical protein U5N26_09110 [Candidatus Marinimicrobia bacterium]|nr:hypothetical protein [Candidatus Neomarinimicrobiota bacterium]
MDADAFDMMYIDISTDDGVTFIPLGSLNPLNDLDGASYISFTNSGLGEPLTGERRSLIFPLTPTTIS